jgi:hypothetical protein
MPQGWQFPVNLRRPLALLERAIRPVDPSGGVHLRHEVGMVGIGDGCHNDRFGFVQRLIAHPEPSGHAGTTAINFAPFYWLLNSLIV